MIKSRYQFGFEIRHLRSFLVIAEELSFRKAATRLHIVQPALTRQIAQLEEHLGCMLFDRENRQIRLTPAGEYLQAKLPQILELLLETAIQTRAVAEGVTVKLRLGFSSAAMSSFLPGVIRHLQSNLQGCEFEFIEDTSDKLIQAVESEQLDVAFILYQPAHPDLEVIPIRPDSIGLILPDDHKLIAKQRVMFEDLKDETLVLFPRSTNSAMYDDILGHCHNAGFSPKAIIETAPRSTAIGLVAARQGVATIAESLQHSCIAGTIYRPLQEGGPKVHYSAIVGKGRRGLWLDLLHDYLAGELQDEA